MERHGSVRSLTPPSKTHLLNVRKTRETYGHSQTCGISTGPILSTHTLQGLEPSLVQNSLNGHAIIRFDQPGQELRTAEMPSKNIAAPDAMTLLIVQLYAAPRHNSASIRFTTQSGNDFNLLALWGNGAMYFDFGSIGHGRRLAAAPPKAFIGSWRLVAVTRTPDGMSTIHVNGALLARGTHKAFFAPNEVGNLVLGAFDFHGDTVIDQLDEDNFIDHYLTQIYFDNVDWPGNNIAYWGRAKTSAPAYPTNGRWQVAMVDLWRGGRNGNERQHRP